MSRTLLFVTVVLGCAGPTAAQQTRPNILWITIEDLSPRIGPYGHEGARTPRLDALAKQGIVYENAFASSPVCAPARACLITGMYPSSFGAQYMRCRGDLPAGTTFFPTLLRDAGYYCSNNAKEDYNIKKPKGVWDQSNNKAHWRGRKDGQPFFSVFNLTITHESKIRVPDKRFANITKTLSAADRHDPAKVRVPAYYPDTPIVRRDIARLDDLTTVMDQRVGKILDQLENDGLAGNTIVFFFSDHGDGLPRGKRWLYDSGLRVPFIARYPDGLAHLAPSDPGTRTKRLVSFVDMAPTVLSLLGIKPPKWMHGRAFAGASADEPRSFIHATRDRMDERTDVSRAVSDGRWKYIFNYTPWVPWTQYLDYAEQMPTQKELRRLKKAGKLSPAAAHFMADRKPLEELYDTLNDPDEVVNLAADPKHEKALRRLGGAHWEWTARTRDLGVLNESTVRREGPGHEFDPLSMAAFICIAADLEPAAFDSRFHELAPDMRAWAAKGISHIKTDVPFKSSSIDAMAADDDPEVHVPICRRLAQEGDHKAVDRLIATLESDDPRARRLAANALDVIDDKAVSAYYALVKHSRDQDKYVARICQKAVRDFADDDKRR